MRRYWIGSIFLFSILSLFVCVKAQAQDPATAAVTTTTTTTQAPNSDGTVTKVVETTRQTIVTPVPAAKEIVAIPQGYTTCFNVEAGWYNNVWIPSHRVCQYANMSEGIIWIEGYWGCNKATAENICTNWEWKPAHWEKTLSVY